jgi:undecaprenyl-diphosphatase
VLDYLTKLIASLGTWGYAVLFLGAALESAAFIGLFVPGESLVLIAGFFANRHVLALHVAIPVIVAGAIIGDNIGYELGRRLGRPWLIKHGRRFGLRHTRLEKAEAFFKRHGGKAVFLGRFIGFARALVPFLAGSSRMPYRQFLPYNAAGAVIWGVGFTLLGYALGASWQIAEKWIGRGTLILAGLAVLAFIGWRWWQRRRRPR